MSTKQAFEAAWAAHQSKIGDGVKTAIAARSTAAIFEHGVKALEGADGDHATIAANLLFGASTTAEGGSGSETSTS